ncbi:MAG: hypothetical protein ACXAEX_16065 [Promethearchaeota archaeon]
MFERATLTSCAHLVASRKIHHYYARATVDAARAARCQLASVELRIYRLPPVRYSIKQ